MAKRKCGLEIHVYVDVSETQEKLFCNCKVDLGTKPNMRVCPRCSGQPGCKPMVPNKEAVSKVVLVGLMLGCRINSSLIWQRKHYDWPDLPKGYQTTMSGSYAVPVGERGSFLGIGITEVHLEEDPARWNPVTGEVDYNRSGYPLIEIVTEPDFRSVEEVREWLQDLMKTLSYVKAVDRSMGVKCDVNVSVGPAYGRVEIKNVNSFKSIMRAIEYEVLRQERELSQGKKIKQQTRAWDDGEGVTKFMRSKEEALDYRFIPDPDLPVVEISEDFLRGLKKGLPERPLVKAKKLVKLGVEEVTASIISRDLYLTDFLEKNKGVGVVWLSNWLRKELLRVLNLEKKEFEEVGFDEAHLRELIKLWEKKEVTPEIGRGLLEKLVKKDFSPAEEVKKKGLEVVKGAGELKKWCEEAIKELTRAVADYRAGSEKALNAIVGLVMKKSKGKADPGEVKEMVKKLVK